MFTSNTDKAWEYFGSSNPYFGVLTNEAFQGDKLDDNARKTFFESGDRYVEFVRATLRDELGVDCYRADGLDFGCGVGRLTMPLARVCKSIVGLDVSESMLEEARKNSRERGISNATFAKSDDNLSAVAGPLGFVHSFIVFQHIPPERGRKIVKRMIDLLQDDGIGVLHFTCSWSSKTSSARRLLADALRSIPALHAVRNLVKGRPIGEPMMQMNRYDLNDLLRILQEAGCHRVHVRFTETSYYGQPFYGLILFFQKRRLDVRAHA